MRDAERVRYLVLAAQREGNRQLAAALRPLGLTPSQAEVVRVLGNHGPQTLTSLGSLLVCESGTNPSRLVDRLVDAGIVLRDIDADDRRLVRLSLTPTGASLEARVRLVEESLYAAIESVITAPEAHSLVSVLERLIDGTDSARALELRRA